LPGWNSPGYNNPDLHTPTLDAMAADGVKLTSHYVYRYCSPTRAALLTGRNPTALANCRENFIPITLPQGTDRGFTMLPARLAEAGYVSHQVGKVRLAPSRQRED
jgi:arylsulfatase A-like enzyme